MQFIKEGYKTVAKAIVSLVNNRWSWKWPEERLEHFFGNIGPINYKILGVHGVCGVNTISALQIKALNI